MKAIRKTKPPELKRSGITRKYMRNNMPYYIMAAIGLIFIITFRFMPLYGMQIAFKDYNMGLGITGSKWVGLKWFKVLFESPDFMRIFRNTIMINLLDIIFVFFGSIIFAILISEIQNPLYKKTVQTISYLPHFLSWVVVGGLIIRILSPSGFVIRTISDLFGIEPFNLLLDENKFYGIVTAGEMWKSCGWNTILYLAAIAGISPELYEAARVDGAGKLNQIIHITLPGLKFIIVTMLLMRIGSLLGVGFEKVFVLQNEMILNRAEVFSTYNYRVGIGQWNMSLSTALSFFESIVNFAMVFTFDRIAKMMGEDGLL